MKCAKQKKQSWMCFKSIVHKHPICIKGIFFLFLSALMLVLSSCQSHNHLDEIENELLDEDETIDDQTNEIYELPIENIDKPIERTGMPSPISGIFYDQEASFPRPMAIVLDNHPASRWQAGINQAEIVYEIEVEFPYTRYLAIYVSESPQQIGPVRSARPYFLDYALEFDAVFVHVGGSNEALRNIRDYQMASISAMTSNEFWRFYETGKTAPNNMYTAMENLRSAQSYMQFREEGNYEPWLFHEDPTALIEEMSQAVFNVTITYNQHYNVIYDYDEEVLAFKRYVNNQLQIDEHDETAVHAMNILLIKSSKTVLDHEGRLAITTVGSGTGYYITMGRYQKISWEKEGLRDKTYFYDEKGEALIINPGQTWIQVVTQKTEVLMEETKNDR